MERLNLLQELLRIPSYSGQEREIQNHIRLRLVEAGAQPFFQGENLVLHLKGGDESRAFIFNSHVDVVSVGEEGSWKHGPWSGDIENGRIYGRGASDMKSGVFASIQTAISLIKREGTLPCDVWFTYVAKEEVDGSGTKEFAEWFKKQGYLGRYREVAALFTEPTSLSVAEYGHRGNFFIKASISGDTGHSARPHLIKKHAMLEVIQFIGDLRKENMRWQKRFKGLEFAPPTITPTAIEAKSGSPNKVSEHCEATFDLRTVPGFHKQAFRRVEKLAQKYGIELSLIFPDAPTGYTSPEAKIVRVLQSLVPGLKLEVSEASADLGFLTELGVSGVIFGPGEKDQSHKTDESAPLAQIEEAPKLFEKIYDAWASSSV
ncbi:MAG: M20/M25/M40 family metallo-hydrolase [bacterium]|nr:M20/M25/M40 family metallo-hydrolase [bacterium]